MVLIGCQPYMVGSDYMESDELVDIVSYEVPKPLPRIKLALMKLKLTFTEQNDMLINDNYSPLKFAVYPNKSNFIMVLGKNIWEQP